MNNLENLAARSGFAHRPFVPGERPPMALLAMRLDGRGHPVRRWGAGLTGTIDGVEITIAECEMPGRGKRFGDWDVMLVWRASAPGTGQPRSSGDGWPHGGMFVRDAEWVAWRLAGNLTTANLETFRAHLPEARSRF